MSTKEKLIAAARELIYRQGYNNTSIRDILLAANAGKGQLYYYFDSKKSIGLAVIKENIAIWQKELFEGILAPARSRKRILLKCSLGFFPSINNNNTIMAVRWEILS